MHIKFWRQAYKGIIYQFCLDNGLDINDRTKHWSEYLIESRKGIFLTFDGKILVGYSTIGKSYDDYYSDYSEVYAIYFDPDYFGKGVGKVLFHHSLKTP